MKNKEKRKEEEKKRKEKENKEKENHKKETEKESKKTFSSILGNPCHKLQQEFPYEEQTFLCPNMQYKWI